MTLREELTLTELAEAAGMSPPTLAAELRRGSIPGVPASAGNPGSRGRFFDRDTCIRVLLFAAQRRASAGNKRFGERASAPAANHARHAIVDRLKGKSRNPGALAIIASPEGKDWFFHFKDESELKDIQGLAFGMGAAMQTLPLEPVAHRLATAFAKANGIDLAAVTDAMLANVQQPETKAAGATANGPDTTDARGPGGIDISPVRATDPAATGVMVGLEGVTAFYQGAGLRVAMPSRFMREMARRLEAVADELEGKPRASVTPSWDLVGEVAGNA